MTKTLHIDGLDVELTRKAVRNINLRVRSRDGAVLVSASRLVSEAAIERFVRSKQEWIELHVNAAAAQLTQKQQRPQLSERELKRQFCRQIDAMLPECIELVGENVAGYSVRTMTSRWGSCSINRRRITLNTELFFKPEKCLRYVIIHELVHFKERGHGELFKRQMDRYLPNWRQTRKQLNQP